MAQDYSKKRTTTLLRLLTHRAYDGLIVENEELAGFVLLMQETLAKHPELVLPLRSELLRILAEVDWLEGVVEYLEETSRAEAELRNHIMQGSVPH